MANPVEAYPDARRTYTPSYLFKRWAVFVGIGFVLYLMLYSWAEYVVREYAENNRFYMIMTAPHTHYDNIILGASHAMPLAYDDMDGQLEAATGTSTLNLSIEGGGVVPASFLLDYFQVEHSADTVIFFLDSFAFYSPEWNEERLNDPNLFRRAPFDLTLVATMWRHDATRPMLPWYVSGFSKINDGERWEPDIPAGELKFDKVYRPNQQIDRQRVGYLYPTEIDQATFDRYLEAFDELIETAQGAGACFVVVKPPTPERYRALLPQEDTFDTEIAKVLDRRGVLFHNFSETILGDEYFYDTDHLNREGTTLFVEQDFGNVLTAPCAVSPAT